MKKKFREHLSLKFYSYNRFFILHFALNSLSYFTHKHSLQQIAESKIPNLLPFCYSINLVHKKILKTKFDYTEREPWEF